MDSSQMCLLLLLVLACWRGWVVLFWFLFVYFVPSLVSTTLINRNKAVCVNLPDIYSCIQSSLGLQFVCSLLNIKPHLDLSLVIVSMHSHHIEQSILPRGNNFVDYVHIYTTSNVFMNWLILPLPVILIYIQRCCCTITDCF